MGDKISKLMGKEQPEDFLPKGIMDVMPLERKMVKWMGFENNLHRCKCIEVLNYNTVFVIIPTGAKTARKIRIKLFNIPIKDINDSLKISHQKEVRFVVEGVKDENSNCDIEKCMSIIKNLAEGKLIWVEFIKMDEWGRVLANIYLSYANATCGEQSINELVRNNVNPEKFVNPYING